MLPDPSTSACPGARAAIAGAGMGGCTSAPNSLGAKSEYEPYSHGERNAAEIPGFVAAGDGDQASAMSTHRQQYLLYFFSYFFFSLSTVNSITFTRFGGILLSTRVNPQSKITGRFLYS